MLALVALTAVFGVEAPTALSPVPKGRLVVKERHVENGSAYIEGAYQYVVVKRRDGSVVFRARFSSGRVKRLLRTGSYRLASYTRTCSGTCDNLDPPSHRCSAGFRVKAPRRLDATVRTAVGERCRIRFG